MTRYDKQLIKESQKYFSWRLIGAAHVPRSTFTQETQHVRGQETQTLPHSGLQWRMRCHAWRKALFWSSSFSPTLRNASSSAHLSAAALNGRHTNTEPWADSHYNVLESTWHTKHHTQPFSLWGVLPLPRSVLHLFNQISDLSSEVLRRGAGQ